MQKAIKKPVPPSTQTKTTSGTDQFSNKVPLDTVISRNTEKNTSSLNKNQLIPGIVPEWLLDDEIQKEKEISDKFPQFHSDKVFELPNIIPTEGDLNLRKEQLFKFINNETIFRKHIPKQHELNKFLDSLKQKVIHDFELPLSAKELSAEYKNSPFFKDIIKYIRTNTCRYIGGSQTLFKSLCEDFILIDGVLFKIRYANEDKGTPTLVLCIPEKYIPAILHQYHSTILAGHPGVTKLYLQLRKKFFFPGLYAICRQYVISCLDCQSRSTRQTDASIHYPRIPLDYKPMSRFSMDIKYMPPSTIGI